MKKILTVALWVLFATLAPAQAPVPPKLPEPTKMKIVETQLAMERWGHQLDILKLQYDATQQQYLAKQKELGELSESAVKDAGLDKEKWQVDLVKYEFVKVEPKK